MGVTDLNCSGLIIVAIIMAILIFLKEFRPFLEKMPDFSGNFINILSASLSGDGMLMKCKLGDHAGNKHGEMKPPKMTHMKQDQKDQAVKALEAARQLGSAVDPTSSYNEEKLEELEKARKKEQLLRDNVPPRDSNITSTEDFEVKKLNVDSKKNDNEVFNIDKNLFEFKEAEAVCKYYNSDLATYDQVTQAYDKGANWCNYGWVKTGQAVYPIQKDFYDNLSEEQKKNNHCGSGPGIVGGFMPSQSLRLGVNCYGKKPEADPDRLISLNSNTDQFIDNEKNQIMNQVSNKIYENKVNFKPFSNSQYSNYSKDKTKYMDSSLAAKEDSVVANIETNDIIKEEFVGMGRVSRKNLVEKFIFDNKGLSEEFYKVMKTN